MAGTKFKYLAPHRWAEAEELVNKLVGGYPKSQWPKLEELRFRTQSAKLDSPLYVDFRLLPSLRGSRPFDWRLRTGATGQEIITKQEAVTFAQGLHYYIQVRGGAVSQKMIEAEGRWLMQVPYLGGSFLLQRLARLVKKQKVVKMYRGITCWYDNPDQYPEFPAFDFDNRDLIGIAADWAEERGFDYASLQLRQSRRVRGLRINSNLS